MLSKQAWIVPWSAFRLLEFEFTTFQQRTCKIHSLEDMFEFEAGATDEVSGKNVLMREHSKMIIN